MGGPHLEVEGGKLRVPYIQVRFWGKGRSAQGGRNYDKNPYYAKKGKVVVGR